MPIKVVCPSCSATLTAPDAAAGKRVKCKQCQAVLTVPGEAPPPAAPAAPPAPAKPAAPAAAKPVAAKPVAAKPVAAKPAAPPPPPAADPNDMFAGLSGAPAGAPAANSDDMFSGLGDEPAAPAAEEDEEDDRPRKKGKEKARAKGKEEDAEPDDEGKPKKKKKKGSKALIFVGVGLLAFCLLGTCGGGLGYYFLSFAATPSAKQGWVAHTTANKVTAFFPGAAPTKGGTLPQGGGFGDEKAEVWARKVGEREYTLSVTDAPPDSRAAEFNKKMFETIPVPPGALKDQKVTVHGMPGKRFAFKAGNQVLINQVLVADDGRIIHCIVIGDEKLSPDDADAVYFLDSIHAK